MQGVGKLRLVLDYVPCDACLAVPASSVEEQELFCSVCRRLDRTIAHKVTVRRLVEVPEPVVPEEVVVPAVLPAVEVVLADGAPVPEPEADVQVVLAPLEEPAPAAPPAVALAAGEDDFGDDDVFGFEPTVTDEIFAFEKQPPEPAPAAEPAPPAVDQASYTLEPWPEEETPAKAALEPEPAALEDWPEFEPERKAEEPPAPQEWPAEPAREEPPAPAEWPEETREEPAPEEVPEPPPAEAIPEPEPIDEVEEVEDAEEVVEAEEAEEVAEAEDASGGDAALPVTTLDGLGGRYERRLAEEGVRTIGDLAGRDAQALADVTGIPKRFLEKWIGEAKKRA